MTIKNYLTKFVRILELADFDDMNGLTVGNWFWNNCALANVLLLKSIIFVS